MTTPTPPAPSALALQLQAAMEENARLREALEHCSNKLHQMGNEFSGPRFTDRHGDGPACLELVAMANQLLATPAPVGTRKEDGK